MNQLIKGDTKTELWREYQFGGQVYRINKPRAVYFTKTSTTHRVVDSKGIVHCVPAPGNNGCVLRWQNKPGGPRVNW